MAGFLTMHPGVESGDITGYPNNLDLLQLNEVMYSSRLQRVASFHYTKLQYCTNYPKIQKLILRQMYFT